MRGENKRTETVAFRTTPEVKALVNAAAARRGVLPSDVLRDWTRDKVVEEFGEAALPSEPEETNTEEEAEAA